MGEVLTAGSQRRHWCQIATLRKGTNLWPVNLVLTSSIVQTAQVPTLLGVWLHVIGKTPIQESWTNQMLIWPLTWTQALWSSEETLSSTQTSHGRMVRWRGRMRDWWSFQIGERSSLESGILNAVNQPLSLANSHPLQDIVWQYCWGFLLITSFNRLRPTALRGSAV